VSFAYTGAERQQADISFWALLTQSQESLSGQSTTELF